MDETNNASNNRLIKTLILVTALIAGGPFLLLMTSLPSPTNTQIRPALTEENIRHFNADMVINAFITGNNLSFQQRSTLTHRLNEIQNAEREKPTSCDQCNQNVAKLLQKVDDAAEEAKKAKDAARKTSTWVFWITLSGISVMLILKMKKARRERSQAKRRSESVLVFTEWLFPAIVLIITAPWWDLVLR